jgi:hypothetical protein
MPVRVKRMHQNKTPESVRNPACSVEAVRTPTHMPIARRRFLGLTGAGAVFAVRAGSAKAQSYPNHPTKLIVGFPAGGPNDILAR